MKEVELLGCYSFIRPLLFKLEPETAHKLSLKALHIGVKLGLILPKKYHQPVNVMGIQFPNRLGLASGFDRHCEYLSDLGKLGFGFIEAGTIVPEPQPGNPKPRIFRLPEHQALINRIGFYSKGGEYAEQQLQQADYIGVLGISLGKNLTTAVDKAVDDYVNGLRRFYAYADFITINISSPNTPGLRELQFDHYLNDMLQTLKDEQQLLETKHNKYVPIAVKIDPDLSEAELNNIANTFLKYKVDGVIATNTMVDKSSIAGAKHADEEGGLSGAPIFNNTVRIVKLLHARLGDTIPIIACGGIMTGENAKTLIEAGASLVQIYTGFIYQGPRLIKQIITATR